MFGFVKTLFFGNGTGSGETSVAGKIVDMIDAATDSPDERIRKQHLSMINSKGADTRRLLVVMIVPFALLLLAATLICEASGVDLPPNYYSTLTWLFGIVGVIIAFYFEYGRQNTMRQLKLTKPDRQSQLPERFKRNREEDQDYENKF